MKVEAAAAYMQDLHADYVELGVSTANDRYYQKAGYENIGSLFGLMEDTMKLGKFTHDSNMAPRTTVGERALSLVNQGMRFNAHANIVCCDAAETKLIENLKPEIIARGVDWSPIVLADGDQPIGILKFLGEKSVYGLETDLTLGIVAGAFSSALPEDVTLLKDLMRQQDKWNQSFTVSTRAKNLPSFEPVRFSKLAVPSGIRKALTGAPWDTATRAVSHEMIRLRACELLKTAKPLDQELQAIAETLAPDAQRD